MIVVIRRVFPYRIPYGSVHSSLHCREIILIACKLLFLFIIQSVEAKVLQFTTAARRGKGIIHRRLCRNFSPLCGGIRCRSIHRQTAFIELLAVVQHIFRHLSKVNVEVATILCSVASPVTVYKRVHKPELNILNIGCLKVVGVKLPHHTTPMLLWVKQMPVSANVAVKIVRTAFIGIISHVQNRQCRRRSAVGTLVAVRIKFTHVHLTHIRIA